MPSTCILSGTIADIGLEPEVEAVLRFRLKTYTPLVQDGMLIVPTAIEVETDSSGAFSAALAPANYTVEIFARGGPGIRPLTLVVPDEETVTLGEALLLPEASSLSAAERAALQASQAASAAAASAASATISPAPDNQLINDGGFYVPGTIDLGVFT